MPTVRLPPNKQRDEGAPSEFRDWANIPVDIVGLISEKVKSITDYVRFRAVCSPWRSASLSQPRHVLPQLPWLMIPYMPFPERLPLDKKDDGVRLFYDHRESKMRKLHLPETIGMMCCASYRGWLLLVAREGKEVFLLNPLTRARVQLPPFTLPVKRLRVRGDLGVPDHGYDVSDLFKSPMGNFVITRVTFYADLSDPNCLITVFLEDCWGIFYCQVGDPCWAMTNLRDQEFVYLKSSGMSTSLYWMGNPVHVVAVHNSKENEEETCQNDGDDPVVDDTKETSEKTLEQTFELYHFLENKFDLKKITDTSNTTLFFGGIHHVLAVCSDDWDLLDGGCVYIEHKCKPSAGNDNDDDDDDHDHDHDHDHDYYYTISFAKMDDVNFKKVACDIARETAIWPPAPAMWFQPSYV
ncbi:F-box family protein [Rhynchospora pubera]|uniref:F-box family protein n=1 Tax=Rhynchospora pubera TaxID=906938 RepID=A0AAV8GGX3_9POAL|nr:F-box family protein [Rhynchospora pubera]